ncbi:uncharacterized protein LOC142220524 isoform X1 [Haematobia irritans]|uniref:uncharacterized protein LOC142220524 isoform X1 n=1 Tax=Haematobia irritans TaxID=7368 RepID=UPI003F4F9B2A
MDNKVEKKIMESFSEEIRKQVDIINRKMQDIVENLPISLENRLEKKLATLLYGPARTSAPLFDGSGSYDRFKFQFDLVAEKNAWNHSDKGIEMVLALKGNALEVLRGISYSNRTNYTEICTALQQKYGDPSIVPMQLENHSQKPNESLEEFAKSLELLMPISSTENNPIVDQMRAKTFINGIRDPQIRRPLMAAS